MSDQPADDIAEFMADLRAWAASTHRFAQKVHALSALHCLRASELQVEAYDILHHVRTRRRVEREAQDLIETLRQFGSKASSTQPDGPDTPLPAGEG